MSATLLNGSAPPTGSAPGTLTPAPLSSRPRVAIIGAGCSGLVSLKACLEHGLEPICFEMGGDIGGLWVFGNSNGRSGAYRSLHINTSTKQMEFSDFKMRTDIGDYPHHSHIKEYFQNYAAHFGLEKHIEFHSQVTHCEPQSEGGYKLLINQHGRTRQELFDALIVASGHHSEPSLPPREVTSGYAGQLLHSHHYVDPQTPSDLRGKKVLVVGMGNSAMDIACELCGPESGAQVCVAARRGAWVIPKYLFNKPVDQGTIIPRWLPAKLRRRIVTEGFVRIHGKMSDFGLPEPDHLIGEAHPTLSSEFAPLVKSGVISMRPGLVGTEGTEVIFSDHKREHFDAIVLCTGYKVSFNFFSEDHICAPDNELPLYFRIFHPTHRHVFFVGLVQTLGAVMPTAERQAQAVALHLSGKYHLPESSEMMSHIEAYRKGIKERFVASARHTMQVVPEDYHPALARELQLGKVRARENRGIGFVVRTPSTRAQPEAPQHSP